MLTSTTPTIAEREIIETLGVVSGEAIIGAHIFRDLMAGITNIIGGRASGYEHALRQARDLALQEMQQEAVSLGANAVVGIDLDYESVGPDGGMLMVTAAGTAVLLREGGHAGSSSSSSSSSSSASPWDTGGGGFGRRRP